MNATLKLLTDRASCRVFKNKRVPSAVVDKLVEAGIHAPTGGNLQPYSIIKIEKMAARKKLAKLCWQPFISKAPLHFVFCVDLHRHKRWARLEKAPYSADRSLRPFWIAFQDTIICAQNMCVAADALGLGSVYIGPVFDSMAQIRRMCKLPKGVVPVVSLAVGYPKIKPPRRKKLPAALLAHSEVYREATDKELLTAFRKRYEGVSEAVNKKDLKVLADACRVAHNTGFAEKCLDDVKARGNFNAPQIVFGLHYRADQMLQNTPKQLRMLKTAGLSWAGKQGGRPPRHP